MSLDMLRIICTAERESKEYIFLVDRKSRDAINAAHNAGEESVASTLSRAKAEIAHLMRATDQKATTQAKQLAESTANKLATLRARAERKLDVAADLIVERIVSS